MLALAVIVSVALAVGLNIGNARVANAVAHRVEEGVQNVAHTTGTVRYRRQLDDEMLNVLGASWPIGLGFLHPGAHFVTGLPEGSIRNTDTGVFGALMTMGVVGTVLIYVPLAYAFIELVRLNRRARAPSRARRMGLVYGGTAWVTWVVAGSATLVLLFSITGVVLTALVLAVLAQSGLQGNGRHDAA
jgi:hypothetical protein